MLILYRSVLIAHNFCEHIKSIIFITHLPRKCDTSNKLCTIYLSRVVRKPNFCICVNKDADQLRSNCAADQRLCFTYIDSTISPLFKSKDDFKPLAIVCDCTARFVSDLVGNPEDRFSHNEAHLTTSSVSHLKLCTHDQDLRIRNFCICANFAYVSKSIYYFAFTWL